MQLHKRIDNLPDDIKYHIGSFLKYFLNRKTRDLIMLSKKKELMARTIDEWVFRFVNFPERYNMKKVNVIRSRIIITFNFTYDYVNSLDIDTLLQEQWIKNIINGPSKMNELNELIDEINFFNYISIFSVGMIVHIIGFFIGKICFHTFSFILRIGYIK